MSINTAITEVVDYIDSLNLGADVTSDPISAANSLANGRAVIVVPPPALNALTLDSTQFEFGTIVATPNRETQVRAIAELELLLLGLIDSDLLPTEAKPNVFQAADGTGYPCYVLTHTTYSD